jgi:hypothetical protein
LQRNFSEKEAIAISSLTQLFEQGCNFYYLKKAGVKAIS